MELWHYFHNWWKNPNLFTKKYIGDGDSKGSVAICKAMPYGGNVFIEKEECVSHFTKRMGIGLREIVRRHKVCINTETFAISFD